ncbi:MAG: hypothetical protein NVSMB47_11990 [Polyangiales bacterium]
MRGMATWALALATVLGACGESVRAPTGLGEPLRVENGQFFGGALPTGAAGPAVLTIDSADDRVRQGALRRKLSGNAKSGAAAIALRFADTGSGYWVVPVGPPDPQTEGDLTYEIVYDLARSAPLGRHPLQLSAVDEAGRWGPPSELPLEVASLIPAGHVVISLEWDADVDLDLQVTTPEGKRVDPKHPTTATDLDGGVDAATPGLGVIDRDSNGGCVIDGLRAESLAFKGAAPPGRYRVAVDLFDACGRDATRFTSQVRVDGALRLQRSGRLQAIDATGGSAPGLFVADVDL